MGSLIWKCFRRNSRVKDLYLKVTYWSLQWCVLFVEKTAIFTAVIKSLQIKNNNNLKTNSSYFDQENLREKKQKNPFNNPQQKSTPKKMTDFLTMSLYRIMKTKIWPFNVLFAKTGDMFSVLMHKTIKLFKNKSTILKSFLFATLAKKSVLFLRKITLIFK